MLVRTYKGLHRSSLADHYTPQPWTPHPHRPPRPRPTGPSSPWKYSWQSHTILTSRPFSPSPSSPAITIPSACPPYTTYVAPCGFPSSVMLIGRILVGHPIIPNGAPTLPRSRAGRPCAAHPRTGCQHRREQPNTGGVFRRTRSYTRPHPPSPIPLSPSFDRPIPTSRIIFLSAGATVRSCCGALPR
jgi:hypothetical protein